MSTMRFMSTIRGQAPKTITFDSSPGRAIGQAIGAGLWDERSYKSELKETQGSDEVYEVTMTRKPSDSYPDPKPEKVGILSYRPSVSAVR